MLDRQKRQLYYNISKNKETSKQANKQTTIMQGDPNDINKMHASGREFEIVETPVPKEFELMDLYWRASNYLAVGQVRLLQRSSCFGFFFD